MLLNKKQKQNQNIFITEILDEVLEKQAGKPFAKSSLSNIMPKTLKNVGGGKFTYSFGLKKWSDSAA